MVLPARSWCLLKVTLLVTFLIHRTRMTCEHHLPDLNSKLVVVCMLCQTDLSCTANVLEVALECLVDLLDSTQEVRVPLILQKEIWRDVRMYHMCCISMLHDPCQVVESR